MRKLSKLLFCAVALALTVPAVVVGGRDAAASIEICRSEADVTHLLTSNDSGTVLQHYDRTQALALSRHVALRSLEISKAIAYLAPTGRAIALVFFDVDGCMTYNSHIELDQWREIAESLDVNRPGKSA